MKVLITGASGLVGRVLVKEFQTASWDVLGLAFSRAGGALCKVDIRDEGAMRLVVQEFKPDAIVHAAVERRPDVVEKSEEKARRINCNATEIVAKLSTEVGAYMIYISTDYVFDGTTPPYKPTDKTNPLNKYGQQKLEGEKLTLDNCANSAIVRVPILYGQVEMLSESAVTALFEAVLNKDKPGLVDDCCIRCPTHARDVAVVCRQLCERSKQDHASVRQIFHWCSNEFMTKYTMVTTMADIFKLSHDHLQSNPVQPADGTPRPKDCSLDRSVLEEMGIGQTTPYREGIMEALAHYADKAT